MKIKYEVYENGIFTAELSKEGSLFPLKKEYKHIEKFCKDIFSVGGSHIAIKVMDIVNNELELRGSQLIEYSEIIKIKGRAHNDCHASSSRYWKKHKDTCKIVPGYTLLDGHWASHTWVITNQNQIVDGIIPVEKYYGRILDDEQSAAFCKRILSLK